MTVRRLLLWVLLLLLVAVAWRVLDPASWTSVRTLIDQQAEWSAWARVHPMQAVAGFFAIYVVATALSLPAMATALTLLAGALFGVFKGSLIVSFASTFGATLAFLSARYLLREPLRRRFATAMATVDAGIKRDGAAYLFGLRLVPVFPFFLVNLLMGLTSLPTRRFYLVSQIGMLPATLIYVNAGTQLAQLESIRDIASPTLLSALALLGVLPLAARPLADWLSRRRLYRPWRRPQRFDRNLIVIGAGSGGLVTAYIAAATRASVSLIERHRMGGDCLNTGCVPSKALLHSASRVALARQAQAQGLRGTRVEVDFAQVMERVQAIIERIAPHDSPERYRSLGVDVIEGEARLLSPWEVEVSTAQGMRRLTSRAIVIATGARPHLPSIAGLLPHECLTSDSIWSLRTLPRRLVVVGGGPIGCEMALAFARLGAQVTLLERGAQLLSREDEDVGEAVAQCLAREGVQVHTGWSVMRAQDMEPSDVPEDGAAGRQAQRSLICAPGEVALAFDAVLFATGRRANLDGLGLQALGLAPDEAGYLPVDPWLRTRLPNIFAVGDVTGLPQFTHAASHMAWHAAVNALFGRFRRFRVDWRCLPQCTYLDPEVARVGLNEREAQAQGVPYEVTRFDLTELDRAITDDVARGFVKVLTMPASDRILGATIVAAHAGESIAEFTLAMRHGLGLNKILATIHAYPTLTEANKLAAGQWRRAHAPAWALKWAQRLHGWHRG
jgi:pyruvate/2-oxoglutarate dehydrogenase complex dihydrolipoamide dehydrogenase (E3) component/uncharacterized membrane protein YdjX (TVP38/TMEM64 family)